jgi:hypothetical protein
VNTKLNLLKKFNLIWVVQPSRKRYFASLIRQISGSSPPSRSGKRGVRAVVTKRGAGCDGREGAADERRVSRTAKSCGSGAPTLALRLWSNPRTTGARKPGPREEHEENRKTIAQGRPGQNRWTCGDVARVLLIFRTRGYGRIGRPAFPVPSVFEGLDRCMTRTKASREVDVCPTLSFRQLTNGHNYDEIRDMRPYATKP